MTIKLFKINVIKAFRENKIRAKHIQFFKTVLISIHCIINNFCRDYSVIT